MDNEYLKIGNDFITNLIIENMPSYVFWKNSDLIFMGCNKKFAESAGLKDPNEIIGKTDYDISNKETADYFREMDKEVIKTKKSICHKIEPHTTLNGEEMWISISKTPIFDNDNNVIGILCNFDDVTDIVNLRLKLVKNEEKYRNLIETTHTSYIIMDTNLVIKDVNIRFADLIKVDIEKIIYGNPRAWVVSKDIEKFDRLFSNLIINREIIHEENISFIKGNSEVIDTVINANVLENGGIKIVCLIRDITDKNKEINGKYIEVEKKKDRIKQQIQDIRERLSLQSLS